MAKNDEKVKIDGFYWLIGRYCSNRWILKIKKLGDKIPQEIQGELFDTEEGTLSVTDGLSTTSAKCVFACEIGTEVSKDKLEKLKNESLNSIETFFGS